MRKASLLLLLCFISSLLFSQTGTIKVAKPAKKDTLVVPKKVRSIAVTAGSNYTFKEIKKLGYEVQVLTSPIDHPSYIGLKYSHEIQYYQLSPYNKESQLIETAYSRSETTADYLSTLLGSSCHFVFGARSNFFVSVGLTPEYLLKTKNQYSRLNYSDFNRFNLAGIIAIKIPVLKHYPSTLVIQKTSLKT
ncbi:MAG TPA: hypothetical protein VGC65_00900 [Bacteroidia bacterium]|jgi:hypothetical protein